MRATVGLIAQLIARYYTLVYGNSYMSVRHAVTVSHVNMAEYIVKPSCSIIHCAAAQFRHVHIVEGVKYGVRKF